MRRLFFLSLILPAVASTGWAQTSLPIIDAHSQIDHQVQPPERVVKLMDRAGVSRTILAARGKTPIRDMLSLAQRFPNRITAAVRTKGGPYQRGTLREFKAFLNKQIRHEEFAAMGEVLLYNAPKTDQAGNTITPEVAFLPDHPNPAFALKTAISKGWPFIFHIETQSLDARKRSVYLEKTRSMLRAHPKHPFVLIHMGQLGPAEVRSMIGAHRNLYFIPSHTTPIILAQSDQPWTAMFDTEGNLLPAWRDLIVQYPDRFILGFDNVWRPYWDEFYVPQVKLWRRVLADLPDEVAHRVAHRNAEKLWNLPPAP